MDPGTGPINEPDSKRPGTVRSLDDKRETYDSCWAAPSVANLDISLTRNYREYSIRLPHVMTGYKDTAGNAHVQLLGMLGLWTEYTYTRMADTHFYRNTYANRDSQDVLGIGDVLGGGVPDTWAYEMEEVDLALTYQGEEEGEGEGVKEVEGEDSLSAGDGTTETEGDGTAVDDETPSDDTGDADTGDSDTGDNNTAGDDTGDGGTGVDETGDDATGDDATGDDATGDDTGVDDDASDDTGDDADDESEDTPSAPESGDIPIVGAVVAMATGRIDPIPTVWANQQRPRYLAFLSSSLSLCLYREDLVPKWCIDISSVMPLDDVFSLDSWKLSVSPSPDGARNERGVVVASVTARYSQQSLRPPCHVFAAFDAVSADTLWVTTTVTPEDSPVVPVLSLSLVKPASDTLGTFTPGPGLTHAHKTLGTFLSSSYVTAKPYAHGYTSRLAVSRAQHPSSISYGAAMPGSDSDTWLPAVWKKHKEGRAQLREMRYLAALEEQDSLDAVEADGQPDTIAYVSDTHLIMLDLATGGELGSFSFEQGVSVGTTSSGGVLACYLSHDDTDFNARQRDGYYAICADVSEGDGLERVEWTRVLADPGTGVFVSNYSPHTASDTDPYDLPVPVPLAHPPVFVTPSSLSHTLVVFVTPACDIYCLSEDGDFKWSAPLPGLDAVPEGADVHVSSQPLSDSTHTVVLEIGDELFVYNALSGSLLLHDQLQPADAAYGECGIDDCGSLDADNASELHGRAVFFGSLSSFKAARSMFITTGNKLTVLAFVSGASTMTDFWERLTLVLLACCITVAGFRFLAQEGQKVE
ncbi:hypothetical protein KIPB_005385 [Kipferlia bialata]|uniref:Uncharacterized protein n=1 Tax=Kipferlia bialata TaxID=797122 RepID=A0A9K3CWL1_9EUKA|nr:hypothetical protein KIPB_005385 [Kipferlia bialata]|eukprot:g5385.t1